MAEILDYSNLSLLAIDSEDTISDLIYKLNHNFSLITSTGIFAEPDEDSEDEHDLLCDTLFIKPHQPIHRKKKILPAGANITDTSWLKSVDYLTGDVVIIEQYRKGDIKDGVYTYMFSIGEDEYGKPIFENGTLLTGNDGEDGKVSVDEDTRVAISNTPFEKLIPKTIETNYLTVNTDTILKKNTYINQNLTVDSSITVKKNINSPNIIVDNINDGKITLGSENINFNSYVSINNLTVKDTISNLTIGTLKVNEQIENLKVKTLVLEDTSKIPVATDSKPGVIKVGNMIDIDSGVLNPKIAKSYGSFGVVKVKQDSGLTLGGDGTLSGTTASSSTLGMIKVGNMLEITSGVLNPKIATSTLPGVVKIGNTLEIDSSGLLNVKGSDANNTPLTLNNFDLKSGYLLNENNIIHINSEKFMFRDMIKGTYGLFLDTDDNDNDILRINLNTNTGIIIDNNGFISLQPATENNFGVIKIGDNLSFDEYGKLIVNTSNLDKAASNKYGVVKVNTTNGLTISSSGELSINKATAGTTGGFGVVKIGDGLNVSDGVVSVKTINTGGLTSSSSGLSIKTANNGGLKVDSDGISINFKTDYLKIDGGQLTIDLTKLKTALGLT